MKNRKLSRRDVLKGSTALALETVFAFPARAQAPPSEAITPQLIEAAKKEAKVVVYSAMDLPVGEKLGKAFEAQYPGIQVQIERSGSERLFQRIAQEFASNIHAADVINSSAHFLGQSCIVSDFRGKQHFDCVSFIGGVRAQSLISRPVVVAILRTIGSLSSLRSSGNSLRCSSDERSLM